MLEIVELVKKNTGREALTPSEVSTIGAIWVLSCVQGQNKMIRALKAGMTPEEIWDQWGYEDILRIVITAGMKEPAPEEVPGVCRDPDKHECEIDCIDKYCCTDCRWAMTWYNRCRQCRNNTRLYVHATNPFRVGRNKR